MYVSPDIIDFCQTTYVSFSYFQTDLGGIKWKRLRSQAGSNMDVLDDPILASYAKCLKADMLCSWARVPVTDGTPAPNNFMGYAKELWVFWYGDEPTNLQTYLASDLQGKLYSTHTINLYYGLFVFNSWANS